MGYINDEENIEETENITTESGEDETTDTTDTTDSKRWEVLRKISEDIEILQKANAASIIEAKNLEELRTEVIPQIDPIPIQHYVYYHSKYIGAYLEDFETDSLMEIVLLLWIYDVDDDEVLGDEDREELVEKLQDHTEPTYKELGFMLESVYLRELTLEEIFM